MEKDIKEAITFLVTQLQKENSPDAALKFSQAALNLAHVLVNYKVNNIA